MYQKIIKTAPSGAAAVGKTKRQREVCRLLGFLKNHVKTNDTLTTYKGKSPAKVKYSYQMKTYKSKKCTPQKKPSLPAADVVSIVMCNSCSFYG